MCGSFKDKSSKRYAEYKHAVSRLFLHYKIRANEELYHKLCKYIKNSNGDSLVFDDGTQTTYIQKQSCSRSVWKIDWNKKSLLCIYDKTRRLICTFLPGNLKPEEIQYKRWMLEGEDNE